MSLQTLTCTGQAVDDRLNPVGEPCGRQLRDRPADLYQRAMAAGWAVADDGTATCPACRRPAPEVVALIREVGR